MRSKEISVNDNDITEL